MQKLTVGLAGTRGLVGSILLQRMLAENDFANIRPVFFSGSQVGQAVTGFAGQIYHDAYDLSELAQLDVILTCQGSDYTKQIYTHLRQSGWQGYFIDAASHLRLQSDSEICLDPVNGDLLQRALKQGIKTFVGGNCTVTLLLLALQGLIQNDLVEWVNVATYQAASGAGIQGIKALLSEMQALSQIAIEDADADFLQLDAKLNAYLRQERFEKAMGSVLAGSVLPWIDSDLQNGISREEAKMEPEATKIMAWNKAQIIPMDSICVRVGALRCHSQAVTLKLKQELDLETLTRFIATANPWIKVIPNHKAESLAELTPAAVAGTLNIAVGRIRKLNLPGPCWSLFTVGDQLLWGAAEPLRRMLRLVQEQGKA